MAGLPVADRAPFHRRATVPTAIRAAPVTTTRGVPPIRGATVAVQAASGRIAIRATRAIHGPTAVRRRVPTRHAAIGQAAALTGQGIALRRQTATHGASAASGTTGDLETSPLGETSSPLAIHGASVRFPRHDS